MNSEPGHRHRVHVSSRAGAAQYSEALETLGDRGQTVTISAGSLDEMLERIEDLKDRLSLYERAGDTAGLNAVAAELGLDKN